MCVAYNETEYYVKANVPKERLRAKKKDLARSREWILANDKKEVTAESTNFNPVIEEKEGVKFYLMLTTTERHRLNKKTSLRTRNKTLSDY